VKLTGKNVWIVGASSGIGLELARTLAENGNFVFVTARRKQALLQLRESYPRSIKDIDADITSEEGIHSLSSRLNRHTDVLDFVVLCAGMCEYDDGPTLDVQMYKRTFDLNFFAHVECIKIALPLLKKSEGTIVGISSLASVLPFPRAEAYGASKAAFEYFLSSLKIDLQDKKVKVAIVRPGFVDTPLTKRNDFYMPFLCDSKKASYKIISGLESGKSVISFPWQMAWVLSLFILFKHTWQKKIATNFKKAQDI